VNLVILCPNDAANEDPAQKTYNLSTFSLLLVALNDIIEPLSYLISLLSLIKRLSHPCP